MQCVQPSRAYLYPRPRFTIQIHFLSVHFKQPWPYHLVPISFWNSSNRQFRECFGFLWLILFLQIYFMFFFHEKIMFGWRHITTVAIDFFFNFHETTFQNLPSRKKMCFGNRNITLWFFDFKKVFLLHNQRFHVSWHSSDVNNRNISQINWIHEKKNNNNKKKIKNMIFFALSYSCTYI